MIITETITINDTEYLHTYSSEGYIIERDGIEYGEAIDPIGFNRIYTETSNKIQEEVEEQRTEEEAIGISNEELKEIAIVATPGLTYKKDKYYYDEIDQNIYVCIRDDSEDNSGTVLYYMPHDLVGAYFDSVNEGVN